MIEIIILIVGIFVLSGIFWHSIFYQKEKKLLNRLQQMLDYAIDENWNGQKYQKKSILLLKTA